MPSATILITDGAEEIEFVTAYDVLIRAGFQVKSIGVKLKNSYATCSRNVKITPDLATLPSQHSLTDILLLPGGAPCAETLRATSSVLGLIRRYRDAGRWVGAICAGTTALVASAADGEAAPGTEGGKGARVTSHPSVEGPIVADGRWEYAGEGERVVVDEEKKIITSRGPGTALGWALEVVRVLAGEAKMKEVRGPMVCAETL